MPDQEQQGETPAEEVQQDPVEQPQTETDADEFDKERAMATINKLREFEKKAVKLEKLVEQYQAKERERQEAEMTELEKAQKRAAELENQLKAERVEKLRLQAAAKFELPAELTARLQGETLEELEADAEKLAELVAKPKTTKFNPTQPNNAKEGKTKEQRKLELGLTAFSPNIFDQIGPGGGVVFPEE